MARNAFRLINSLAALAWLTVGGYGVWQILDQDSGEYWQIPYLIVTLALVVGGVLTVVAVWNLSRGVERPPLRWIGLAFCALGVVLSTVAAWAVPVWMTLFAIGFGLIALSGSKPWRRAVALLAAAQLVGMAVMFTAMAAEVGRRDEYGDHPAAFGIGLVVTAAATVLSLYQLDRSASHDHARNDGGILLSSSGGS